MKRALTITTLSILLILCNNAILTGETMQKAVSATATSATGTSATGTSATGTLAASAAATIALQSGLQQPALQQPGMQQHNLQQSASQQPASAQQNLQGNQVPRPVLDSLLLGTSVFENISVNQSDSVKAAFAKYVEQNSSRKRNGYRIRIYISNAQNARAVSEDVEKSFKESFPEIPAYISSSNPYFKVTVGNYRNRSDAARALNKVKEHFPGAFIVKEHIDFPEL